MLGAVVYMVVVLVVVAVVYWAVDKLGTPQPLNNIIKVGVVAVAIIIVVVLFLQMLGIATPLNIPRS
jgi:hypothetical protein